MNQPPHLTSIFLIEDNPDDLLFFNKGVASAGLLWEITQYTDGTAYDEFLAGEKKPLADLIFIDLNLPKRSGVEVIANFRSDPRFEKTPILILSGSASDSDVERAMSAGCNSYFVKPNSLADYVSLLKMVDQYWFQPQLIFPRTDTLGSA